MVHAKMSLLINDKLMIILSTILEDHITWKAMMMKNIYKNITWLDRQWQGKCCFKQKS